jgi:hypothetical protein
MYILINFPWYPPLEPAWKNKFRVKEPGKNRERTRGFLNYENLWFLEEFENTPGTSGSFGSAVIEMLGTGRFSDLRLLETPGTRWVFL